MGALLIVDPGAVFQQALAGGKSDAHGKISSWKGVKFVDFGQGLEIPVEWLPAGEPFWT